MALQTLEAPPVTGAVTQSNTGTESWNADAYRRAGDPAATGQTAASPYGSSQPAMTNSQEYGGSPTSGYPTAQSPYSSSTYGTSSNGGYQQPASYQQYPQSTTATASRAYASDAGGSGYSTTSPSSYESSTTGSYRPGSTSRETGRYRNRRLPIPLHRRVAIRRQAARHLPRRISPGAMDPVAVSILRLGNTNAVARIS